MVQLKDVITGMRTSDSWTRAPELSSFVNLWRALDQLDAVHNYMAFFRRILLLRMAYQRDRRTETVRDQIQSAQRTRQSSTSGKVESIVLDGLVREIFPHTTEDSEGMNIQQWREKYDPERKKLSNRLFAAKNWRRAVEVFGFGILALIPTAGVFRIQNQRLCETLLNLLKEKGNGYVRDAAALLTPFVQAVYDGRDYVSKIVVEHLNELNLEPMDPSRIVELCNEIPESEQDEN
ncbi:uncharacterized protein A1O5_13275 [Cladophialophora psammophila CBS 110553]|uniref:Uncharacterized protein n=1 Tax=Cladophialophora psammophila CBS 110553 TaxID=1182543 RepID=W9W4I6_9EURO|nr:uncharacterized protein A1O5_13275 [Cladophialophora psammophila CBS 110553]EXJ53499.1 hypothetical protein A1O5_13275 [Cladophialophora psammophila CBS 110553]